MKKASSAKNGGLSLLINWVDWTVIQKVAGVRNAVMMWLVSQRYWAAPASARLTVGVKSCTQVFILRLCSFIRPWMGSLKIGLSQPKSRFTLESKATTPEVGAFQVLCVLLCLPLGHEDPCCKQAIVATHGSRDIVGWVWTMVCKTVSLGLFDKIFPFSNKISIGG